MRILKIKAYQIFANYRKPMSFNFWDTYPLPSLSTIRGWFHSVINADKYIPLSMSIQGNFSSVVYDMQTLIKFDRVRNKKGEILLKNFKKVFSKSPTYVANIFNIELIIYLKAEEKFLQKFKENLLKIEYPSLGRREDLARIDFLDFIETDIKTFDIFNPHSINYGIYLNKKTVENEGLNGIHYRMNFKYNEELLEKTLLRYFEKKDVVYIDEGILQNGKYFFDEYEEPSGRIIDLIGDDI